MKQRKPILQLKDKLRTRLSDLDSNKRPEALIHLTLLWAASPNFSSTPDDIVCVFEELRREFGIDEIDIKEAMKGSELLGKIWRQTGNKVKARMLQ